MTANALPLTGQRALVTGGLGFLGLNLVGPLLDGGAQVRLLSRSLDPLAIAWLDEIRSGRPVEVLQGDAAMAEQRPEWFVGVDYVFHLAGESGAEKSLRKAHQDMEVNVSVHLGLLEALRARDRPPRVVFASSRLVYGATAAEPVNEQHATQPTSLYGVHKLAAEHYHRIYWMHHGVPYCSLRITNPYGPYQLPSRRHYGILNRFMIAALAGDSIPLYGGGSQLRDYVHVDDVARALLAAAIDERAVGQTFNLGSGQSIAIGNAARRIVDLAGSGRVEEVPWPPGALQVETGDFLCDISHIDAQLGWRPRIGLDEGLTKSLGAYRSLPG
jgi:UDP-glucose 4-epimerase